MQYPPVTPSRYTPIARHGAAMATLTNYTVTVAMVNDPVRQCSYRG